MNAAEVWHQWVLDEEPALPPEWWGITRRAVEAGFAAGVTAGATQALTDVARWLGAVGYQINPMNHDGSNYMIDKVVQRLDALAGTDAPSRVFEDAWDEHMDKYEADYYGGDGKQRQERRARARATSTATDAGRE